MGRIRKLLAWMLAFVLLMSAAMPAGAAGVFTDVKVGDWYHDSIARWAQAGVINGYEDGSFAPVNHVKRGEFAKIIANVLGLKEQSENIFEDVSMQDWYAPYVLACVKAGIINGYEENGKTLFRANAFITRQEAIKIYVTALKLTGGKDGPVEGFSDGDQVGIWARGYVNTILSYGAMQGRPDGSLAPTDNITRAEVAVILDRLIGAYADSTGAVSVTTEAERNKAGNLVVVHAGCGEKVSVHLSEGNVIVSGTGKKLEVVPANGKEPVLIFTEKTLNLEEGVKVTVSVAGIETERIPAPTEPTQPQPEETEPTKPTQPQPEETEPTEPSETEPEETVPTEPEVTEPVEPPATEPEDNFPIAYSVTVLDYNGNPKEDVVVQVYQKDKLVAEAEVNADGMAVVGLKKGDYSVKLVFAEGNLYYEEKAAVLSVAAPHITLKVAPGAADSVKQYWFDETTYLVDAGATYVEADVEEYNYFIFKPTTEGMYQVATSDPAAELSFWGANTNFISNQTASVDYQNNSFTLNVKPGNLGNCYIIGIKGALQCILEIFWISDPILDISDTPRVPYEATKEVVKFTLPKGVELTQVNVTADTEDYKLVLNRTDGYYHLNSEDGPILYMNLKNGEPFSLKAGLESGNFYKPVYDDKGNPVSREDYRILMEEYWTNCDSEGWYPVTYDLRYMVENGGKTKGWWDKDNPNSSFWYSPETGYPKLNPELAWMYSCSYGS